MPLPKSKVSATEAKEEAITNASAMEVKSDLKLPAYMDTDHDG